MTDYSFYKIKLVIIPRGTLTRFYKADCVNVFMKKKINWADLHCSFVWDRKWENDLKVHYDYEFQFCKNLTQTPSHLLRGSETVQQLVLGWCEFV